MKKISRHIIAVLLILALGTIGEILIFNHDTLKGAYGILRFNVAPDEDQTYAATGYSIETSKEDKLSPLSDEEENEIKVRHDNERIMAEYKGEEYVPSYEENMVVNADGTHARRIKQMNISMDLGGEYYIKKLKLEADLEETGGFTVMAYKGDTLIKEDMYCSVDPKINAGVMNVSCKADHLEIVLLTEEDLSQDDIRIEISSKMKFNFLRASYIAVLLFTIYVLVFAGKDVYELMKKKPEWFFAIFAIMLGGLIAEGLGTNMVSYDEYAHAKSAYKLSYGTTIETTEAAMQMVGNTLPYFNNPEERELIEAYEDLVNDPNYIAPDIGHQTRLPRTETRVYYPMALGFRLGRALHLGFADMMGLARLGNLLCYVFIVFWAVKKAKGYQMVVAAIGLLPNNIFVASSLSYDMLVNACLLLGYVLLINEMLEPDEKVKPVNAFFMLFAFMVGCLSKPVYIIMSLMLLFLPKKKFENDISEWVFKLALIGLNGLMLYNIFFPTPVAGGDYALVTNNAYAGDKRNIGTSTMGQLQFVLSNPLVYTKILLKSMLEMISDYTIKRYSFVTYAYMGNAHFLINWVMVILGVFAALFANVKTSIGRFKGAMTHLMNFGVVAIVFSSMYISYTPVGNEKILGVQGRYVIPLFLPFLSCFLGWGLIKAKESEKAGFICKMREKIQAMPAVYERIIFAVMMCVSLLMTLFLIILKINV